MQENHFLPVNWIDGMKINKSHFIAQDNAFVYQLAQNTSCILNELNYGLLPVGKDRTGVKIFISTDNQKKLQVRIQQCRAITSGGFYIEFNEDTAIHGGNLITPVVSVPQALKELKNKGVQFYVVLSIDPYTRLPYGSVDTLEIPPRIPYTLPTYHVSLIPVAEVTKNVLGPFHLPVGKLTIDDQRVLLEEDYIPPCSNVTSHPELLEIQAGLEQFYSKMESYSIQIIQRILQKKQTNEMAVIVQKLCENISFFTASELAELKSVGIVQPPVYMVSKTCSLARLMKNTIDCFLGNGKEELVNYFTEWCNISQGELEGSMVNLANLQYDHLDINNAMDKVSQFTKIVSKLFYQLSRLEYIGKRKEAGIFVKEEAVKQGSESQTPKRRSFLAD
ncbi:MAG: hypothetical protein H7Y03_05205 [Chitinophagaceae bacterium]|nr:hypothetical protein [Chitinophagaceae bacterium]